MDTDDNGKPFSSIATIHEEEKHTDVPNDEIKEELSQESEGNL